MEPIEFGAQSLLVLNHCQTQIIIRAQLFMDPNYFGAQSLFDINAQARSTLEEANPFGAQSWLELNVGGSPVLAGAHSSREPNP